MSFKETDVAAFYDQFNFGNLTVDGKPVGKSTRFWSEEFLKMTKDQPIFLTLDVAMAARLDYTGKSLAISASTMA